jgi:hypothetical protein
MDLARTTATAPVAPAAARCCAAWCFWRTLVLVAAVLVERVVGRGKLLVRVVLIDLRWAVWTVR